MGLIELAKHSVWELVSQIFPVTKKSGGVLIIINSKQLSSDVHNLHFKIENFLSVLNLMEEDCFMGNINSRMVIILSVFTSLIESIYALNRVVISAYTCLPNGAEFSTSWVHQALKTYFCKAQKL